MDIHIWYTLLSALVGGLMGALGRLGEVIFQICHSGVENYTISRISVLIAYMKDLAFDS